MKNSIIDPSLLQLPAFKRAINRKRNQLIYAFGKVVDGHFKGIEDFKVKFRYFRQLSARANKSKDLNEDEQKRYAIYKRFFREKFKVGPCTFCVRADGKVKKVSFGTVSAVFRLKFGLRIIKHGKSLTKNEHWQNFFLPEESKIDNIYGFYISNKEELENQMKIAS